MPPIMMPRPGVPDAVESNVQEIDRARAAFGFDPVGSIFQQTRSPGLTLTECVTSVNCTPELSTVAVSAVVDPFTCSVTTHAPLDNCAPSFVTRKSAIAPATGMICSLPTPSAVVVTPELSSSPRKRNAVCDVVPSVEAINGNLSAYRYDNSLRCVTAVGVPV